MVVDKCCSHLFAKFSQVELILNRIRKIKIRIFDNLEEGVAAGFHESAPPLPPPQTEIC